MTLKFYFLFVSCWVLAESQDCFLPRNLTNCDECAAEGLDLSTGCTTCVSPLSIECEEGEQNCAVGNFVFSALFHSYRNPTHMCAECSDSGPVTCESVGRGLNCGLRFIYCLQPFGSQSFDPPLVLQSRFRDGTDDETFEPNFFSQLNFGSLMPQFWSRSNPLTRNFTSWPGRTQFSIAVYNHATSRPPRVVDRVLIDLELNISSSFTERRTYSGVNNFSHFDMSFRIDGECGVNYYGPQCSIFCRPEEGVFTCDSEGNRVCVNRVLDPAMNCTQCLDTEQDPEDNCGLGTSIPEVLATTKTTATKGLSTIPETLATAPKALTAVPSVSATLVGGVVGGVLGAVLLLLMISLVVILCIKQHTGNPKSPEATQDDEKIEMTQNQVYGVNKGRNPSLNSPAVARDEKIEMTRNQVYGVNEGKHLCFNSPVVAQDEEKIEMTRNQVYGVNEGKNRSSKSPAVAQDEKIEMTRNQVYGVNEGKISFNSPAVAQDEEKIEMTRNQVYGAIEAAGGANIVMKANVVYGVNKKSNPRDHNSYDYK